jgi:hypothetical protein
MNETCQCELEGAEFDLFVKGRCSGDQNQPGHSVEL